MPLAKNIIYTGPIDEFFNYKYGALEYRITVFLEVTSNSKCLCSIILVYGTSYSV